MSVIRCKTCKNLFNTVKQERYCSEECRKEARKKVRKKWETRNPEYMKIICENIVKNSLANLV
ncbi:hypothetical protein KF7HA_01415 [Lactococcus lactis]|nr:hypothetical protein [Lactococcus lactis]